LLSSSIPTDLMRNKVATDGRRLKLCPGDQLGSSRILPLLPDFVDTPGQ
jgi:hypothetical protein